jgi:hypothetical protein
LHGAIDQAGALAAASPHAATALARAFGVSFAVSLGICLVALVPAALLPGRRQRISPQPHGHNNQKENSHD